MERKIRMFGIGEIELLTDLGSEACITILDYDNDKGHRDTLLDRLMAVGCENVSYGDHNTHLRFTILQQDDSPMFRELVSIIVDNYITEAKEAARGKD